MHGEEASAMWTPSHPHHCLRGPMTFMGSAVILHPSSPNFTQVCTGQPCTPDVLFLVEDRNGREEEVESPSHERLRPVSVRVAGHPGHGCSPGLC